MHQLVHLIDGIRFLRHCQIRIDKCQDISLFVRGEQLIYLCIAQALDAASGLGGKPAPVWAEACEYAPPLLLGEHFLLRISLIEHFFAELGESALPGRIDSIQRQLCLGCRMGKGTGGDFGRLAVEVRLAKGADGCGGRVEGGGTVSVEGDKMAAYEIILHLCGYGIDRSEGGRGGVPVREHVSGAGGLPGLVGGELGVELLYDAGVHSRRPAAVGL